MNKPPSDRYAVHIKGFPGEKLTFTMPEAPSTGYMWQWDGQVTLLVPADDEPPQYGTITRVVLNDRFIQMPGHGDSKRRPAIGGGGYHEWRIALPAAPGSYHGRLHCARPWPGGGTLYWGSLYLTVLQRGDSDVSATAANSAEATQ